MATAPQRHPSPPPHPRRIYYPTSDGKPMGATDKHVTVTMYCISALRAYFADRPEVYVAGDNFLILRGGQSQSRRFPGLLCRLWSRDAPA
ncbi:MAG TPA: hypothetical protein VFB38_11230 [Chthonomonadaceae bacterium]|nr:hypothetical protein [Chthonomonadaceae bacterium]